MTDGSSSSSASVRGAPSHAGSSRLRPARSSRTWRASAVAVGPQARRHQADEHVAARARARGPACSSRSTTPTANPARSNSSGSMAPGCSAISPPSRAQPDLPAAVGDPRHELAPPGRGRACRSTRSRGGTAARHPRTPGRRRTWRPGRCRWCRSGPRPARHERLGPDPVGRRHQHRLGGSGRRRRRSSPPNPPIPPSTSGRAVEATSAPDAVDSGRSPAATSTPAPA